MDYRGDFDKRARKPISSLFLILFAVLFFMILGIIFISYSINTKNISQRDLYKGSTFDLKDNDSLKVRFDGEMHNIDIKVFGSSSVEVTVRSEPITKLLRINESAFFDLNSDGKNDLRIFLVDITNYQAILEFKRIDEGFCVSDWKCEKWGGCIDGLRKRNCEDLNGCGRFNESPDTQKFCSSLVGENNQKELDDQEDLIPSNVSDNLSIVNNTLENKTNEGLFFNNENFFIGDGEMTCSQNNGNVCISEQKCDGNWINSSDSLRCCFGNCFSSGMDLSGDNNSIVCDKSVSLFRFAVSNCTYFKMDCIENILIPELGLIEGFESVFEIQGYSSGNKCLFYYGYRDVFVNYTNEKFSSLINQGNTLVQINFELETLQRLLVEKYQNKNLSCKYPQEEFLIFARAWEDGNLEWSRDILGKYECVGELVGI